YSNASAYADAHADSMSLSRPVKTRAIAPTGTIAIIGETTTGIEPVFCVAYKRRWLQGREWRSEYVIDPTAERMIAQGVHPDDVEDAYALAKEPERRVAFQAWVQRYVDHGISSTLNLEHTTEDRDEARAFGNMLLPHLPNLRGMTCYPNGARGGQP